MKLRTPFLWKCFSLVQPAMINVPESDSVLSNLKRHYLLSWLSLYLYRKGFRSCARDFFNGALEIGKVLQFYLTAKGSDNVGEEKETGLYYNISETEDCRFRISFYQSEDVALGDFETFEECEATLKKMGIDQVASRGSLVALAQFSASKPELDDIVDRISGKSTTEIAKEYKLLSDGYHQVVNEACLLRLKTG